MVLYIGPLHRDHCRVTTPAQLLPPAPPGLAGPAPVSPLSRTRSGPVLAGATAQAFVGVSAAVSALVTTEHMNATQAVRYAVACLLLVLVARLTGRSVPLPRRGGDRLLLVGIAVTGLVLFNVALVHGSRHAEPAVFGVAVAGAPLLLAVLGPLLSGQRPRVVGIVAAGVLTAGVVLIQSVGRCDLVGLACAFVVLACEVAFTLLAVPVLARSDAWVVSVHTTWIAAAGFGMLSLIDVSRSGAQAYALTGQEWAAVAYLAVAMTALAFVLWYGAVETLGAARAGLLTGVAPVSAAIGGVLLGGPMPPPLVWLGIAVVVAGITLGLEPSRRPAANRRPQR